MSQETNSAPVTENKMGTMPIGRLVFNMSLPMMISMLVQALYNLSLIHIDTPRAPRLAV